MTQNSPHNMIPKSELKCIWMEAGVVGYKLCDHEFRCEQCPFDLVMRQPFPGLEDNSDTAVMKNPVPEIDHRTPRERVDDLLDAFFSPLNATTFPHDRLFHKGHLWIQECPQGDVKIGIDHIGARFLDSLVSVVLPLPGLRLTETTPFCWLIHRGGAVTTYSPLNGTITASNSSLAQHPELILRDPYETGWIAHVLPEPPLKWHDHHPSERFSEETSAQLLFLRQQINDRSPQTTPAGTTLADGGRAIDNIADLVGQTTFLQIVRGVFRP